MDKIAIIMAGGQGTRMKSELHKVLHPICGKAMIDYLLDLADELKVDKQVVVVGHNAQSVLDHIGARADSAFQDHTTGKGTGHAVMSASSHLQGKDGIVYILASDMPLLQAKDLIKMEELVLQNDCVAMLTAVSSNPFGYGRIVRQGDCVTQIVEQRDCTEEQKQITEINASIFCLKISDLLYALPKLDNHNNQNEYYLTDIVKILNHAGKKVLPVIIDEKDCMGVNDRVQLAQVSHIMQRRILNEIMYSGVTVIDPNTTYVQAGVVIGQDSVIYPQTTLQGKTMIGKNCVLRPGCRLENAVVQDNVTIEASVVVDSEIGSKTTVGPNAYIRANSKVGCSCRVGDFVEIKNSTIGDGTKMAHLTYVGDADLGSKINLGCGTVFTNYDGKNKYRTVVGDNSFIGCNVNLIAPVVVEADAYIAAGSTITKNVPSGALAVARHSQINREGWVQARKEKGKL